MKIDAVRLDCQIRTLKYYTACHWYISSTLRLEQQFLMLHTVQEQREFLLKMEEQEGGEGETPK